MTDPIVRLETPALSVEPGGQGRTLVTVRNLGTIVEGFRLQVLGEGVSEWAEVSPPEVQVYPEQEATAVVVFSPPAGNSTRSGTFPFAVRAESVVDSGTSALAEGDLEIGRVFGLQSKITPVTSSGRWRGKHFLEITNWGNAPVRLKLTATDPDEKLAFLVGPEFLDLPLGVTGHAQLRVRTLAPFLRGAQVRTAFQVVAEPDPPETVTGPPSMIPNPRRATLDGAFVQRPILSKLTVALAALLVVAIGGLVAFLVTRDSAEGPGGLAQGPPRTPALSAVGRDATSVQLLWEPQPNIQNYRINQLTTDGRTAGVVTVDGALTTFVVEPLAPDAEFCFQLQAVRGDQVSPLSATQCARTSVAPPASGSPTPSAVASGGSAVVSPSESAAGSSAAGSTAPPNSADASAGPNTAGGSQGPIVVPPAGTGGGSPTTNGGGAATSAPPTGGGASGSASPGSQAFAPGQYIDVVFTTVASDAEAAGRAEFRRQQLVGQGIPAAVLRTTDYPKLQLIPGATPVDSYLVYVGPFASQQEAQARCTAQPPIGGTLCRPVQPNPAN